MLHIPVRAEFTSILLTLIIAIQLAACSSEENLSDAGTNTASSTLLTWVAPTAREDDTPLSMSEIAGYRIYYGQTQGDYLHQLEINDAYDNDIVSSELNLAAGNYYVVITAIDMDGRESAFSEEVLLSL